MDNELRKKRVLEGIAMLGKGVNPINYIHETLICGVKEYLGITIEYWRRSGHLPLKLIRRTNAQPTTNVHTKHQTRFFANTLLYAVFFESHHFTNYLKINN